MYFFLCALGFFFFLSWSSDIQNPIAFGPFEKVLKSVNRIYIVCSVNKKAIGQRGYFKNLAFFSKRVHFN